MHLVFDGVADGPVGVALDIVGTAARLVRAGLVAVPNGRVAPRQRLVSVDGEPVRTAAQRMLAVDGARLARHPVRGARVHLLRHERAHRSGACCL